MKTTDKMKSWLWKCITKGYMKACCLTGQHEWYFHPDDLDTRGERATLLVTCSYCGKKSFILGPHIVHYDLGDLAELEVDPETGRLTLPDGFLKDIVKH